MTAFPIRFIVSILAIGNTATASAHAVSFDCKAAKTPQEKAVCASPSLGKLDDQLDAAYKAQLASAPSSMHSALRDDERSFLQAVGMGCARQTDLSKMAVCMEPQYKGRVSELQKSIVKTSGQTFVKRTFEIVGKNNNDTSSDSDTNPGFGTLTATWPQSSNASPEWTAWNAAITRAVQEIANPDSEGKKPILAKPLAWQAKWASDNEAGIDATLTAVTDKLVSARIENDVMGHGAAHPNETWMYFHWLLAEKRELTIADIFKGDADWRSFLAARCLAALKRQNAKQDFLYDPSQVTAGIADALGSPRNWNLQPKGLTVVFPEYSVSPRAMPADDVVVPWSALTQYLATDFSPPK